MSVVNNNNNSSSRVISNSTSSSSSSISSTTKKSSSGSNNGTVAAIVNNNSSNQKKKEQQESISSSTTSLETHHFEEEDNPLTPPAISFTTLITDYETELMAFINESDTSRSPSPQPQPDLLIDIQHDEQQPSLSSSAPEDQLVAVGGIQPHLGKSVQEIIDESAEMIINNKNLLNHGLQDFENDADDDYHQRDYENSLTSTTTLDTVIAVDDLASVQVAAAELSSDDYSTGHYYDEQDLGKKELDLDLDSIQNTPQASETQLEQPEVDSDDDNKIQQKHESSSLKSSSKKSSSSTSSTMTKQTSVEKIQQQQKKTDNMVKGASSVVAVVGVGGDESSTQVTNTVNGSTTNNGATTNIEATATSVTETSKVKQQEGVIKQKKKNSTSSVSVHDHEDDDVDEVEKFEEYEIQPSSMTLTNDCMSNGTNYSEYSYDNTNGFHSIIDTLDHVNVVHSEDVDVHEQQRKPINPKNSNKEPPQPLHELDDNEVFNFVSVSKLKSSFTKFDNFARGGSNKKLELNNEKNAAITGAGSEPMSPGTGSTPESPLDKKANEHICKCCEKAIFVMELIRAEREDWHKRCFRCSICKKTLGVDNYCSNEGILFCKPHFRELFQPKPVFESNGGGESESSIDEETRKKKRAEIIIRESEPIQLPPDVVKSTVYDTSERFAELEELNNSLDVKSKFELFQTLSVGQDQEQQHLSEPVKRSSSAVLASRVAKYQSLVEASTMESSSGSNAVGVLDSDLGPHIPAGGIADHCNEESDDEALVKIMTRKIHPAEEINSEAVDSVRSKWEQNGFNGNARKEEARKEEQIKFRSKLLHGKNNQLKEMYEKAVIESSTSATSPHEELNGGEGFVAKAKELKEIFEKESESEASTNKTAMLKDEIFESEITKTSRNLFRELDKSASTIIQHQQQHGMMKSESKTAIASKHQQSFDGKDIVRCTDVVEDVATPSDISNKFNFFEKYTDEQKSKNEKRQFRFTPPREGQVKEPSPDVEIYRDPNIVRACDTQVDAPPKTNTASKMLSVFRQLEAAEQQQTQHSSFKPLKEFTPPREQRHFQNGNGTNGFGNHSNDGDYDEEGDDVESEEDQHQSNHLEKEEILKQVGSLARASSLRAKFEVWNDNVDNSNEDESTQQQNNENIIAPSIDTTKNLRAKFEKICEVEDSSNAKKEAFNKRPVKRFVVKE